MALVETSSFWSDVKEMVSLMAPLAIAALVAQGNACRLDQIFLLSSCLYTHYVNLAEGASPLVKDGAKRVMASLDKRWMASDQEVFFMAALLNPFFGRHRCGLSAAANSWNSAGLAALFKHVYARIFSLEKIEDVPEIAVDKWSDYRAATLTDAESEVFTDALFEIEDICQRAIRHDKSPDPLRAWQAYTDAVGLCELAHLARRLLTIVPNSAANKRVFSSWGLIHTKTRNRLDHRTVMDAARLRAHLLAALPVRHPKRKTSATLSKNADFLSTRSHLAASAVQNDITRANVTANDADFEALARDWFRHREEEEAETYEEDDAAIGAADKLTLADFFKVNLTLRAAMREATEGKWRSGEGLASAEREALEAVGAELMVLEPVSLVGSKRSVEVMELSKDEDKEEWLDVA